MGSTALKFYATPVLLLKISASIFLAVAGMYYLAAGRRRQSVNTMLVGGALVLLALLVF